MANFNSKNEGTWYYFDSSDESLGGVKLRLLSPKEEENIEKLTVKKKSRPVRGVMTETRIVDEVMKNRLLYDAWIEDWNNIELDGKVMSCTTENKVKMMEVTDFARFVLDNIVAMSDSNKTIEEARLKNLKSMSGGAKQSPTATDAPKPTKE